MKFILYLSFVAALLSLTYGEVVTVHSCNPEEIKQCTVNEVRISPCKESLKDPPQPCKFKKGETAFFEIDFTPDFVTEKMHAQMYWLNGIVDLPLAGMETDACKTTTCPSVSGTKQTYTYDLKIASYFPLRTYNMKWVLMGDDAANQQCCFIFKIKISK